MPELRFRNIDASPEDHVSTWGVEGLLTALERGDATHWTKIVAAYRKDPFADVALDITQAINLCSDPGVAAAMVTACAQAKTDFENEERVDLSKRLRDLVARSGLNTAAFAERMGTSRTRLSSYLNARVVPSAVLLARAERIGRANHSADH
jgi:hypothetical protein